MHWTNVEIQSKSYCQTQQYYHIEINPTGTNAQHKCFILICPSYSHVGLRYDPARFSPPFLVAATPTIRCHGTATKSPYAAAKMRGHDPRQPRPSLFSPGISTGYFNPRRRALEDLCYGSRCLDRVRGPRQHIHQGRLFYSVTEGNSDYTYWLFIIATCAITEIATVTSCGCFPTFPRLYKFIRNKGQEESGYVR
jgi:hypothetical protein